MSCFAPGFARGHDRDLHPGSNAADEARESLAHLVILDERTDVWLGSDGATGTLASGTGRNSPIAEDSRRSAQAAARARVGEHEVRQ